MSESKTTMARHVEMTGGMKQMPESSTTTENLINKLENQYAFECEAGSLKNCADWIKFSKQYVALYNFVARSKHNAKELEGISP